MDSKLTDLELCKKIARMEGLTVVMVGNVECIENLYSVISSGYGNGRSESPFWPMIDKALLFDLAFKYEVNTCFAHRECYIIDENAGEFDSGTLCVSKFSDEEGLPRAILECIAGTRNA